MWLSVARRPDGQPKLDSRGCGRSGVSRPGRPRPVAAGDRECGPGDQGLAPREEAFWFGFGLAMQADGAESSAHGGQMAHGVSL